MLVLSRRVNEKIVFPGFGATVQILGIKSNNVRLGIEAPPQVAVVREELLGRAAEQNAPAEEAVPASRDQLAWLVENRLKVAGLGLDQLRDLLQAGSVDDALTIVEKLAEDFHLLKRRLGNAAERAVPPSPPARKGRKALLVEDNANERELLARFLRMGGYDVDMAGDGADALDYLRARGKPDVVLLDMGMPRCDGPTAVRAIRRDGCLAGLKIVGVSGSTAEECGLDRGPGGIDHWVQKPVDPAALLRDLERELSSPLPS